MICKLELSVKCMKNSLPCATRNISFFSTGFDIESVDLFMSLGQECFKIPSAKSPTCRISAISVNLAKNILSSGMSTLGEIEAAIEELEQAGTPHDKITVLHCTSEYPTPMAEVNLRAMQNIRAAFGLAVGYSDHTQGMKSLLPPWLWAQQ